MTADARTRQMLPVGALMGGGEGDDELVEIPCRRCGATTKTAVWILDMVKSWNREEFAAVERERDSGRRYEPQLIRRGEAVACAPCSLIIRAEMSEASVADVLRAAMYLDQARNGTLDADEDAVAWLIAHGYRRQLEATREASKATKPIGRTKKGAHVPPQTSMYGDAPHPAEGGDS